MLFNIAALCISSFVARLAMPHFSPVLVCLQMLKIIRMLQTEERLFSAFTLFKPRISVLY